MLGKLIRVSITEAVGSALPNGGFYKLNHGKPIGKFRVSSPISGVFILGIDNPVKHFDGRVIAILRFRDNGEQKLIISLFIQETDHFLLSATMSALAVQLFTESSTAV